MKYYLAMWCMSGFESIVDITEHQPEIKDKKKMLHKLKGESFTDVDVVGRTITYMTLRGRFNTDRQYEVYGFMSDIDFDTLKEVSINEPQVLVNSIRETGVCFFDGRNKNKSVIS